MRKPEYFLYFFFGGGGGGKNKKGADQTAHLCSLVSTFFIQCLGIHFN